MGGVRERTDPLVTVTTKLFIGGTFNPIHIGHARLALECQAQTSASLVAFVPCCIPPHKASPDISQAARIDMVERTVDELNAQIPGRAPFTVEAYELEREEVSYTVTTLQALRARYPNDSLLWVIGMDSLVSLNRWHEWRHLTNFANLLVVNRPGWQKPQSGEVVEWLRGREKPLHQLGSRGGVAFIETTALDVHSSVIRKQVSTGHSAKFLVPDSVCRYIEDRRLYC